MRILLVMIIQGNETSEGFHYRGWILAIHCFRLTSLNVISGLMDRNLKKNDFENSNKLEIILIFLFFIKI